MSDTPHILAVTPRYRRIPRAWAAQARMLDRAGVPVDHLDMVGGQPFPDAGPGPLGNENILHAYQRARAVFLGGDWSHMLTLEDDMLPPPDALPRLLATGADVAYSLYCWRRKSHPWSPYRVVLIDSGESYIHEFPERARAAARARETLEVRGVGLGCTLISRAVVEVIPFRLAGHYACDWYFSYDVGAAGYRQVADFGVACGHYQDRPSARVIWPDPDSREGYRYEYLEVPAPSVPRQEAA